MRIYLDELDP